MKSATGFILDTSQGLLVLRAASMDEQIKHSIRAILLTRRGERVSEPAFGSDLYRYLFRPLSQGLVLDLQNEVKEAIARSETRVRVSEVEVVPQPESDGIELRIQYGVRNGGKNGMVKVRFHA